MKTLKLFLIATFSISILWSCGYDEVHASTENNTNISLEQLLGQYELWYVDLESTLGNGQTLFVEMAFTLSFLNGNLYANNNLVGFGDRGNGFGISIGEYDTGGIVLDIFHDLDGHQRFEVYQESVSSIELYNPANDTSYFLDGYQRNEFDYDAVFFENIDYFLQEYKTWENTFTSTEGEETEFDDENYLFFYNENSSNLFKSSIDENIGNADQIQWDYTGGYTIEPISGSDSKKLTLDYDFYDADFLELSVINDELIRLYHPSSGKTYEYSGRSYITFMRASENEKTNLKNRKIRPQKTKRKENTRALRRSGTITYFAKQ
jgi:hypothetical protein